MKFFLLAGLVVAHESCMFSEGSAGGRFPFVQWPATGFPFSQPESAPQRSFALDLVLQSFNLTDFWANYFERSALLISRNNPEHFQKLLSSGELFDLIQHSHLEYEKDIKLVKNGQTHFTRANQEAKAAEVIEAFLEGSSVVFNKVHRKNRNANVYKFLQDLERTFRVFCGANAYLSPPQSQCFLHHYDQQQFFVLQLEGSKRWKVCEPVRMMSMYSDSDVQQGEHILSDEEFKAKGLKCVNRWLHAGDTLYLPHGMFHVAETEDTSSLHLTVSIAATDFTYFSLLDHAAAKNLAVKKVLSKAAGIDTRLRNIFPAWFLSGRFGVSYKPPISNKLKSWSNNKVAQLSSLLLYLESLGADVAKACSEKKWTHSCGQVRRVLSRQAIIQSIESLHEAQIGGFLSTTEKLKKLFSSLGALSVVKAHSTGSLGFVKLVPGTVLGVTNSELGITNLANSPQKLKITSKRSKKFAYHLLQILLAKEDCSTWTFSRSQYQAEIQGGTPEPFDKAESSCGGRWVALDKFKQKFGRDLLVAVEFLVQKGLVVLSLNKLEGRR